MNQDQGVPNNSLNISSQSSATDVGGSGSLGVNPLELVDTHCHIHFSDYGLDPEEVIANAKRSGVTRLICVGCTLEDSRTGIEMAMRHEGIWAAIGIHPHEASLYVENAKLLQELRGLTSNLESDSPKLVAIGEIGLDYYYGHSKKEDQIELFRFQLSLAQEHDLPVIFHVRGSKESSGEDVWPDFWKIYDEFKPRGVIHSFSSNSKVLENVLKRDLFVGLNGIMTFTRDKSQLEAAKNVPLANLILETDAPFLTPSPFRGTICRPEHVAVTASFLSELRGEDPEKFARITTQNAIRLFNLKS